MSKEEMQNHISGILCGMNCGTCFSDQDKNPSPFDEHQNCSVKKKTEQQLQYVLSSIKENIFLEACAGSGKTEVVGMKVAYEINRWNSKKKGIAVLTFTNEATETIRTRVVQFSKLSSFHPHYIGTLTGFVHGYISQKFGYKYFANNGKNDDFSYRLIEKSLDIFSNHWLDNYKLSIPYINASGKRDSIYANQIYYDYQKKEYIIYLNDNYKLPISEYYSSPKFQEYVQDFRKKTKNNGLYKLDYLKEQVNEAKVKFLKDGFANFEDMNNIAFKILSKNSKILSQLAMRFPIIFIDECQDLSWIEIQILDKLKQAGVVLHFIGDLNQSIYEFKNANPTYTKEYLSTFINYKLTDNFRSCQPIVDIANRVLSITLPIRGKCNNILNDYSVCYLEYDDIDLLPGNYLVFLNRFNISPKKSSILVRQNALKSDLQTDISKNSPHLLIDALQLWNSNQPTVRKIALERAGKQLQKWFGGAKTKKHYYCPVDINSAFRWRIFVKDFLEACSRDLSLTDFSNKTYGNWYKIARMKFPTILQHVYKNLGKYDDNLRDFSNLSNYRTPAGTVDIMINSYSILSKPSLININTIHSVKGGAFDSVMVVSSKGRQGSGGHWKHWIEGDEEARRIGYVASTRAKYSLIWAVPKLETIDRKQLESYGFKRIELI